MRLACSNWNFLFQLNQTILLVLRMFFQSHHLASIVTEAWVVNWRCKEGIEGVCLAKPSAAWTRPSSSHGWVHSVFCKTNALNIRRRTKDNLLPTPQSQCDNPALKLKVRKTQNPSDELFNMLSSARNSSFGGICR